MMLIRMLKTAASPEGVLLRGQVYDVDEARGLMLIAGQAAEAVGEEAARETVAVETATAVEPETAAQARRSGRRRSDG